MTGPARNRHGAGLVRDAAELPPCAPPQPSISTWSSWRSWLVRRRRAAVAAPGVANAVVSRCGARCASSPASCVTVRPGLHRQERLPDERDVYAGMSARRPRRLLRSALRRLGAHRPDRRPGGAQPRGGGGPINGRIVSAQGSPARRWASARRSWLLPDAAAADRSSPACAARRASRSSTTPSGRHRPARRGREDARPRRRGDLRPAPGPGRPARGRRHRRRRRGQQPVRGWVWNRHTGQRTVLLRATPPPRSSSRAGSSGAAAGDRPGGGGDRPGSRRNPAELIVSAAGELDRAARVAVARA